MDVWAVFWDVFAKMVAQIYIIKTSSGHGIIELFFKEVECLIWVTTHKVSSEFPQDYELCSEFCVFSYFLNIGRFWHDNIWKMSWSVLRIIEIVILLASTWQTPDKSRRGRMWCVWYSDSSWFTEGSKPLQTESGRKKWEQFMRGWFTKSREFCCYMGNQPFIIIGLS